MEKTKKYFKPLMLLGILLVAVGCTNSEETGNSSEKSEGEQNVRTVIEKLFTGPNKEQERMLDYSNEDFEKFAKSVSEYRKTFKPYLSENFFESFVNLAGPLRFLSMAHPNYELKVDDIKIEEKENYYEFTVKVSYTNSKSNQSKTKKVKGHAQTNEEGKVTSINYINAEEFRTALD